MDGLAEVPRIVSANGMLLGARVSDGVEAFRRPDSADGVMDGEHEAPVGVGPTCSHSSNATDPAVCTRQGMGFRR